jgi:hypothetical protein
MAEMIVIEVDCDPALYPKVNEALGLDADTGAGDWPKGLLTHVGGGAPGKVVIAEVWESRAEQEAFMASRLGPALGQVGVPMPSRMDWFDVLGRVSS